MPLRWYESQPVIGKKLVTMVVQETIIELHPLSFVLFAV